MAVISAFYIYVKSLRIGWVGHVMFAVVRDSYVRSKGLHLDSGLAVYLLSTQLFYVDEFDDESVDVSPTSPIL